MLQFVSWGLFLQLYNIGWGGGGIVAKCSWFQNLVIDMLWKLLRENNVSTIYVAYCPRSVCVNSKDIHHISKLQQGYFYKMHYMCGLIVIFDYLKLPIIFFNWKNKDNCGSSRQQIERDFAARSVSCTFSF